VKKLAGEKDKFEARIDYHYRFVYSLEGDVIKIHSLGQHDEGLGKK
jgi:Txe/YoeB family toxin of Txe-Axe toxin-antitoxin module